MDIGPTAFMYMVDHTAICLNQNSLLYFTHINNTQEIQQMAALKRQAIKKLIEANNNHQMHPVHIFLTKAATINKMATIVISESGCITIRVNNHQVVPFYIPPSQKFGVWVDDELAPQTETYFNVKMSTLLNDMA